MITLTKAMLVGIPAIDEQHKTLIDRINDVSNMGLKSVSKEETQKTLDFLGEYIIRHFRDEEELQKLAAYPNYEAHRKMHRLYVAEFDKLKREYLAYGFSIDFAFKLRHSIIGWVVRHIKNADADFAKYYQSTKKA